MIVLDCEQGTREWLEARFGRWTASNASRVVTPGGALSKARDEYQAELLAEWVLQEPVKEFSTDWTERGKAIEADAREYYEFQNDAEVRSVGLIYRDESRMTACSPDGLVGDDGGLELKSPMPETHLLYLARGVVPGKYMPQVQGCLWITGRAWWDWMSYCPMFPPLLLRVEPDEKYQAALDKYVPQFIAEMLEARERLSALGVNPEMFDTEESDNG